MIQWERFACSQLSSMHVSSCMSNCAWLCAKLTRKHWQFPWDAELHRTPEGNHQIDLRCEAPPLSLGSFQKLQSLHKHMGVKKRRGLRGQRRHEGGIEERRYFCFLAVFGFFLQSCHNCQLWGGLQMFVISSKDANMFFSLGHEFRCIQYTNNVANVDYCLTSSRFNFPNLPKSVQLRDVLLRGKEHANEAKRATWRLTLRTACLKIAACSGTPITLCLKEKLVSCLCSR